jgi:hypothetical protein
MEDAVASASGVMSKGGRKLSSSAEPRSRSTSAAAAGGSTSSMGPEVTYDGGARRWTADGALRADGGGSGKVGRMGSARGGSGVAL